MRLPRVDRQFPKNKKQTPSLNFLPGTPRQFHLLKSILCGTDFLCKVGRIIGSLIETIMGGTIFFEAVNGDTEAQVSAFSHFQHPHCGTCDFPGIFEFLA